MSQCSAELSDRVVTPVRHLEMDDDASDISNGDGGYATLAGAGRNEDNAFSGTDTEDDDDVLLSSKAEAQRVSAALTYVRDKLDSPEPGLTNEYTALTTVGKGATAAAGQTHRTKNRYTNITAYDHSRVVLEQLEGDEKHDYINANTVRLPLCDYIASQGPLPGTVEDFWRMVWQQNSRVIVMVTNEREGGREKCARYWPEATAGTELDAIEAPRMECGYYSIALRRATRGEGFTRRELVLERFGEEPRTVVQLHFEVWPDHGVPSDPNHLLCFRQAVQSDTVHMASLCRTRRLGPTVVHCSAGVGRSGTYIAIDHTLQQLEAVLADRELSEGDAQERLAEALDVCGVVTRMREQRNMMVQTLEQYQFVHFALEFALTAMEESRTSNLHAALVLHDTEA
jgi:protein tyrosine phosphatase